MSTRDVTAAEAAADKSRTVIVCDACLKASCWHGEYRCAEADIAGTTTRMVAELDELNREHPDRYSVSRVREVSGLPDPEPCSCDESIALRAEVAGLNEALADKVHVLETLAETRDRLDELRARLLLGSRVILETPYAGDVEANATYLRACLRDSLMRGEAPFASHAIYTLPGVLRDDNPAEREIGMRAGFAWREIAGRTIVYTDRGISPGMQRGIDHAIGIGRPVEYRTIDLADVTQGGRP